MNLGRVARWNVRLCATSVAIVVRIMSPSVDVRDTSHRKPVPYIPLSYRNDDLAASALQLVLSIRPEWQAGDGKVEFKRFTDGITNTVGTQNEPLAQHDCMDTRSSWLMAGAE